MPVSGPEKEEYTVELGVLRGTWRAVLAPEHKETVKGQRGRVVFPKVKGEGDS